MLKFLNLQSGVNENDDDETLNTILFSYLSMDIWQLPTWIIIIISKWQMNSNTHSHTHTHNSYFTLFIFYIVTIPTVFEWENEK